MKTKSLICSSLSKIDQHLGKKTVVKPESPSFHGQDLQMRVKKGLIRTPILKTSKITRHLITGLKTMKRVI